MDGRAGSRAPAGSVRREILPSYTGRRTESLSRSQWAKIVAERLGQVVPSLKIYGRS